MNTKIENIEIKFMQQQKTIEDLDAVICQHTKDIIQIKRDLLEIKELLKAVVPSINRNISEETPPPHY